MSHLLAADGLILGSGPLPTVLLRHEMPDGSQHIDWMVAPDSGGTQPLISFRVAEPLDRLSAGGEALAERIADHRPAYLALEGPIGRGRGRVTRIGHGAVVAARRLGENQQNAGWELEICWESGAGASGGCGIGQLLRLRPSKSSLWTVFCVSINRTSGSQ
ncbi:MAG: hypothetical protein L0Y44_03985 [Phycisphaerales bacterium]|nr:hypothetical protein [Phycisphaerales bacterium]MCI0629797.1 hypothetical protein [Phycisphaerales bacterium]MCI0675525.1 hypothetical protein [Phycisphaerales bacterium]